MRYDFFTYSVESMLAYKKGYVYVCVLTKLSSPLASVMSIKKIFFTWSMVKEPIKSKLVYVYICEWMRVI